jgi:non-heme chloroperoxidase
MSTMAEVGTVTDREREQVERANASGLQPVVFIHGLWLLPSSWDKWAKFFEEAGYAALTPSWPDDPDTVEEAKANPDAIAKKGVGQVADHMEEVIRLLDKKPVLIGHSFGGLLTHILAGRGLAAASVSISPAPFRGVLPLPISTLRASAPVLLNPLNRSRGVPLTYDQFRYSFANTVDEDTAKELYENYSVPASGKALFQSANANLNPRSETKVDVKNPDRGPMLIIAADSDHTVPVAISKAAYKGEKRNPGVTELYTFEGRSHGLTIDDGWRDVAEKSLEFVKRFV